MRTPRASLECASAATMVALGAGYGKALLARLARIAKERGCGRVEWAVLDWNVAAIDFYERLFGRAGLADQATACARVGATHMAISSPTW